MNARAAGFLCTLFLVLAGYFLLAIPVIFTNASPADSAADDALVLLLKILAGAGFVCSFFFAVALLDAVFGARADAEGTRPRDAADPPR